MRGCLRRSWRSFDRLLPDSGDLRGLLESFLRTASDRELVRINPIAFAQSHGCDEAALIDLFPHGRKVGLLRMEWHYVCPGCGDIVESFQSLTSATAQFFCQVCSADREADLSDFIEVTFSVSQEIRESRYHDRTSRMRCCRSREPRSCWRRSRPRPDRCS